MVFGRKLLVFSGRGFSLIELVMTLAILLCALIPIAGALTKMQVVSNDNVTNTKAFFLAQQKADEIRRDDNLNDSLVDAIKALRTPTVPVVCPHAPLMAYCFTGRSVVYDGSTPEGADGIARVLVIDAKVTDPALITRKDVFYELRFAF